MDGVDELVDPVFPWTGNTARLAGPHHAAGGGQTTAENTHMDGRSHGFPLAICTSFIGCDNRHYCQAVLRNLESRDSRCAYVLQRSPSTAAVSPMASMTRPGGTIGAGVSLYRLITPMPSQHAKRLDPYMAPLIRLP
ncbi:hypothetical protein V8C34DRAFT_167832 [Trichoderma compactum]